MALISIIMQYTDQIKLKMLQYLVTHKYLLDPFAHLSSPSQLHCIFRLFDAVPFLRTVWDASPIYMIDVLKLNGNDRLVC